MPFDLVTALGQVANGTFNPGPAAPAAAAPPAPAPISSPIQGAPLPSGGVQSQISAPSAAPSPQPQLSSAQPFDLVGMLGDVASGKFKAPSSITPQGNAGSAQSADAGDLANITSGVNQGLYQLPDAAANLANKAANLPIRGINALFGSNIPTFETDIGQPGAAIPTPGAVTPVNERERVEQSVGGALASLPILAATGGLGEIVAPEIAARAATAIADRAPGAAWSIVDGGQTAAKVAATMKNAPIARSALPVAAGAAAGQVAADNVPAPYAPLANLAGNLFGGGAAAIGQEGALAAGRAAGGVAGRMGLAPKTSVTPAPGAAPIRATQAQLNAAAQAIHGAGGEQLRGALNTDPLDRIEAGIQARMQNPDDPEAADLPGMLQAVQAVRAQRGNQFEIVPGSQPTTQQVAAMPELSELDNAARMQNKAGFLAQSDARNNALLGAVEGQSPAEWSPAALGEMFTSRLAALSNQGDANTATAQQAVETATAPLGANIPEEQSGTTFRTLAQQSADDAKTEERRQFWSKVDPNGTLAHSIVPVKDLANVLAGNAKVSLPDDASPELQQLAQSAQSFAARPQNGLPLHPVEKPLLDLIAAKPDVVPYRDSVDLMSAISAAKREIQGSPAPDQRALTRLRMIEGSLQDSLSSDAGQRMVAEQRAVEAGEMTPEQTMLNKLLALEADAAAKQANSAGGESGDVLSGDEDASAGSGVAGSVRTGGEAGRGPGANAVHQGTQENLQPNVTPEDVEALRSARQATAIRKQTYNQGVVGDILRPGKNGEPYAIRSGTEVAHRLFNGQGDEAERLAAFFKAVPNRPEAAQIARDYLVSELNRRGIIRPDGQLDVKAFDRWMSGSRQRTVEMFPELKAQLGNARDAQETLNQIVTQSKAALKEYQDGIAKRFLNDDPDIAVERAIASRDSAKTLSRIIDAVQGNPDAAKSLAGHVVDAILKRFAPESKSTNGTDDEAHSFLQATPFRKWTAENRTPLRRLLGGQGIQNLDMVRAELKRNAERTQAVKGSQTTPNALAAMKHKVGALAHEHGNNTLTLLGALIGEHLGEHLLGGPLGEAAGGLAGGIVPKVTGVLRSAGINTTNDLKAAAMLHPEFAKVLMQRVRPDGRLSNASVNRIGAIARTIAGVETFGTPPSN